MKILQLEIKGFRGIRETTINFEDHTVLIGPNGSGKSTIIDALSLVLGQNRLVRPLTEHDFCGSNPGPTTRLSIVATLGYFTGNDPNQNFDWFRDGRAVPKWWNVNTRLISPIRELESDVLIAQIAFAARFDKDELQVETIRYFYDDPGIEDPFNEDIVVPIPGRLLNDIGFYLLPALRTLDKSISFGSDLFRRVIARLGGIPSGQVIVERDRLRNPERPLEQEESMRGIVDRINEQFAQLLPDMPRFQLRITATDSDSILHALVPHYESTSNVSLPVGRHGTGLLSLQTLILLLEIGRDKLNNGQNFILALEEPELHLPPGLQRRLLYRSQIGSTQTICTSHSPRVASFYKATNVKVLENRAGLLQCTPLLSSPLEHDARNGVRKLYLDNLTNVIEALMFPKVLIPEGRIDYEWFRLLVEITETSEGITEDDINLPFGSIVGVIPTHEAAVYQTFNSLRVVRSGLIVLVDGDQDGDRYLQELIQSTLPPECIIQWPREWVLENVIIWILQGDEHESLPMLNMVLTNPVYTLEEFLDVLIKQPKNDGIKGDYLMYEEIVSIIRSVPLCLDRAKLLLSTLSKAASTSDVIPTNMFLDDRSTEGCRILRWVP